MIGIVWEARDPDATETWLREVLGGGAAVRGLALEVVRADGPVERLRWAAELTAEADAAPDPTREKGAIAETRRNVALVAVGVATVDTDRYAADAGWTLRKLSGDPLLGAFAAQVEREPIVVLEPNTEGRLAATLTRLGEGPVAIYVRSSGGSLARVSAAADGPFGPEVLVVGRPVSGPHLLLVGADRGGGATIGA